MATPRTLDWALLKRIGRYLVGRPRAVLRFVWQDKPSLITAFSDSDWAGCRETRKSTSGACFMMGRHMIKSYSRTQSLIALSSAEAELYSFVTAASEAFGLKAMLRDYGEVAEACLQVDASAAIGIAHRKGLGKVRHLDCQSLWIQDAIRTKKLFLEKTGTENPSDLLTKGLAQELHRRHSSFAGCEVRHTEDRQEATSAGAQDQAVDLGLLVRQIRYFESLVEKQCKLEGQLGASEAGGTFFWGFVVATGEKQATTATATTASTIKPHQKSKREGTETERGQRAVGSD